MSMNVRFGTETCDCPGLYQVNSEETKKILESENPLEAYIDWLKKFAEERIKEDSEEDYDPDDPDHLKKYWAETLEEKESQIRNYAKEHPNAEWYSV